jgi:isoamylase
MLMEPGTPTPLGATFDGSGVNFAVASAHAESIELCLFAHPQDSHESRRLVLPRRGDGVFCGRVAGLGPGQLYGLRAHGPGSPETGRRFNAAKLLVDPYARALAGRVRWHEALLAADPRDSAPYTLRSVVLDPAYDWGDDAPPGTPWSETVLYECHVKGMTARHPRVSPEARGRYLGLAHDAVIEHLLGLGVTAVSLLPVHHSAPDAHVAKLGLANYWGYSPVGYFAPDARFASGDRGEQVAEFRTMVRRLHAAGIEVIVDVVFNHTAEGDPLGPAYALRGLDDATFYRHDPARPGEYEDFTGCGNTLDLRRPRVRAFVLDCLRHWARELRVDGFRFDLAGALAREGFFDEVRADPELAGKKLVAEPWDATPEGYALGRFPAGFAEWNDRFRDTTRRFWRGDAGQASDLATRLAGSEDKFGGNGRTPQASVNFVTCHDGMTLHDLVSYARKHNEANLEGNRDGAHDDYGSGWGAEGPTADRRVRRARERAKRSLFASLVFALGVPMLSHGDELSRTQRGNNNAYCQDNELTWLDWELDDERRAFLEFARRALALRRANPAFAREKFLGEADVAWLGRDGSRLSTGQWHDPELRAFAMLLAGDTLLLSNGGARGCFFELPSPGEGRVWRPLASSACLTPGRPRRGRARLAAHSFTYFVAEPAR